MKKFLLIPLFILTLTACNGEQIVEDVQKSYNNVKSEVKEVSDKTVETVKDVKTAVDSVRKASEDLQKITE